MHAIDHGRRFAWAASAATRAAAAGRLCCPQYERLEPGFEKGKATMAELHLDC